MKAKEIHTITQMKQFVEGCINDYEAGKATKEETINHLKDYTFRIIDLIEQRQDILFAPEKELKSLEVLYRKENPDPLNRYYMPDKTKFYRWIRQKIQNNELKK